MTSAHTPRLALDRQPGEIVHLTREVANSMGRTSVAYDGRPGWDLPDWRYGAAAQAMSIKLFLDYANSNLAEPYYQSRAGEPYVCWAPGQHWNDSTTGHLAALAVDHMGYWLNADAEPPAKRGCVREMVSQPGQTGAHLLDQEHALDFAPSRVDLWHFTSL